MRLDSLFSLANTNAAFDRVAARIVPPEPDPPPNATDPSAAGAGRPDRVAGATTDTAGADAEDGAPLSLPPPRPDVRMLTAREEAELAQELYFAGVLDWSTFRLMGSPPELDRRYDSTIGTLTGERSDPDRPRDVLAQWEGRLAFAERATPDDTETLGAMRRIVEVLGWHLVPQVDIRV